MAIDRHGGSVHYVRPDRVVRTGVLTSIVGYQPQLDVMAVTQAFTSGPSSGMQLAGMLGAATPGPIQRAILRMQAWIAAKKAQRMMLTDAARGSIPGAPAAPEWARALNVAPQISAMSEMSRFLAARNIPMNGEVFPQRRWNTYFYAG